MDIRIFDSKFFTHCYCIRIYDFTIIRMLIFIFLFCFLIRYILIYSIDHLIGIDVWIRVTFTINVTTNFSIYLLHLSFSPQKKKQRTFVGYLRIRSQILASEIATFLILMMQVHLRGHVRISI